MQAIVLLVLLVFGIVSAPEPLVKTCCIVDLPLSSISSPHSMALQPLSLVRPCLRGGGQGELWEGDMKDVGGAGSVNGRPGMMVGLCLLPCL